MKALARVVATAAALAALSVPAAGVAHAGSPQVDQRSVQRQQATQQRHDTVWRCNAGHGPQADCRNASAPTEPGVDPAASAPAGRSGPLALARSVVLLGLLAALAAGGDWLRRHHPGA